ncbi:hypothetical protein K435DRAFT_871730 [Dendrothele bispora CBS 962.96]|uniref:Uncharacterized protein n=1 Tax=Dendrothele bispora (strain CBS 962.96) TaxID=1314807 RepID=A0A4S8L3S3_DENBC|nr:hypothetical protein K435DRAFT_871730 [Dendrothele bispora CBS 962.96]
MARGRSSKHKIPADPITTSFDKFEEEVRQGNPLVLDALDRFSEPAKTHKRSNSVFARQLDRFVVNASANPKKFSIDRLEARFCHWADLKKQNFHHAIMHAVKTRRMCIQQANPLKRKYRRVLGTKEDGCRTFGETPIATVTPVSSGCFPHFGISITESQAAQKSWRVYH